jgi:hypothetical protein
VVEPLEQRLLLSGSVDAEPQSLVAISAPVDPALLTDVTDPLAAEPLTAATPYPLDQTFLLHSDPTATKTIYLDFVGYAAAGTQWNTDYHTASIVTPPYSFEGDGTFSDAELTRIQCIWERVVEDYIPFDVDVTTQDPGAANLTKSGFGDTRWGIRVCIGGSSSDWFGSVAGGVSYVGSFNWASDTPDYVFPAQLLNGDEKDTAEAISHEVGHTLGLSHDGTNKVEYYEGQHTGPTGWAPIMGAGYYEDLVQWSKGEYPNANNQEDDLAIITTQNGFTYRTDDHGNTAATAASLGDVGAAPVTAHGIIERNTDVDCFSFTTAGGTLTLNVDPFYRSPDLNILATLYGPDGTTVIAVSDVVGSLSASFSLPLLPGTYYLSVKGTGETVSGFTAYGSLGYYSLSATVEQSLPMVTLTASNPSAAEHDRQPGDFTVTRTGDTTAALEVFYTIAGTAGNGVDYDAIGGSVTIPAGSASADITITPIDDTLPEGDETVVLTLQDNPAYTVMSPNSGTVTIADDDLILSTNDYADSQSFNYGNVADGSLSNTRVSDNVYEQLKETQTGHGGNRSSALDCLWSFQVTGGGNVTFFVEAYHNANNDGDDFKFEYSVDGASWTPLLTVTKTSDDNTLQQASLPSDSSGTVYIHVLDVNRAVGHASLDSIYIDRMFIRSDPSILGDANRDGTVDALDYLALKAGMGITSGAMWTQGDFDADGDVDIADLLVLEANFGRSVPPAPAGLAAPAGTVGESQAPPAGAIGLSAMPAEPRPPAQAGPPAAEPVGQMVAPTMDPRDPVEPLSIGQELLAVLPRGPRSRLGSSLPAAGAR